MRLTAFALLLLLPVADEGQLDLVAGGALAHLGDQGEGAVDPLAVDVGDRVALGQARAVGGGNRRGSATGSPRPGGPPDAVRTRAVARRTGFGPAGVRRGGAAAGAGASVTTAVGSAGVGNGVAVATLGGIVSGRDGCGKAMST